MSTESKLYLWDEIGGEWHDVNGDDLVTHDHAKLHELLNRKFDMNGEGDHILYKVNAEDLSFTIGYFGEHNHLFIEMWGPKADMTAAIMKANVEWYAHSAREALDEIARAHAAAQRAVGD